MYIYAGRKQYFFTPNNGYAYFLNVDVQYCVSPNAHFLSNSGPYRPLTHNEFLRFPDTGRPLQGPLESARKSTWGRKVERKMRVPGPGRGQTCSVNQFHLRSVTVHKKSHAAPVLKCAVAGITDGPAVH